MASLSSPPALSPLFPGPNACLIGYTGYVGSNLYHQSLQNINQPCPYKLLINSKTDLDALEREVQLLLEEAESHSDSPNGTKLPPIIDTIVCAGAPGFKLGATVLGETLKGEKYDDTKAMDQLIEDIKQVKRIVEGRNRISIALRRKTKSSSEESSDPNCTSSTTVTSTNSSSSATTPLRFILISTLSAYSICSHAEAETLWNQKTTEEKSKFSPITKETFLNLTEDRDCWSRPGPMSDGGLSDSIYGQNRSRLEKFVKEEFQFKIASGSASDSANVTVQLFWDHLIIRLPGIFGYNMKKNYLFDLLTKSPWRHKINLNTYHQWYPLKYLTSDIGKIMEYNNGNTNNNPNAISKQVTRLL